MKCFPQNTREEIPTIDTQLLLSNNDLDSTWKEHNKGPVEGDFEDATASILEGIEEDFETDMDDESS